MRTNVNFMLTIYLVLILISLTSYANTTPNYLMTKSKQQKITPSTALTLLEEGNKRFVNNNMREHHLVQISKYAAAGQYPFAIVLSCIDSRSAPDFTFDQGLGNIFIARVAGNEADKNIYGSMEFATKFMGAKLIVIMGHTYCGAIVGACKQIDIGNLGHLLADITPAVKTVKAKMGKDFSCNNPVIIDKIAKQNVLNQMHMILNHSTIIKDQVKQHKVMLVGAMHNLVSRKVSFFTIDGKKIY